jgi:hypothetical protein
MSIAIPCTGFNCPSFLTRPSGVGSYSSSSEKIADEIAEMWSSQSITFGGPLGEILTSLFAVYKECSKADWDGYGAAAITADAYEEAKKIIKLLPSSIRMPEIVAEPSGEIGLEWRRGRGQIFVMSVSGRHKINYAGLFSGNTIHGSEYFDETLPALIIEHLRRLYS